MRTSERDAGFTSFVTRHRGNLLRAARLLATGDEVFAEDLVQTTLTKTYLAWPKVCAADDPLRYAQRMLTNVFIDESRLARRRRERSVADPADQRHPTVEPADSGLRDDVLRALAGLAPQQRAVVVLRHWLDQDIDTTARTLGCTAGAVKSANSRALAHLRESLAHLTNDIAIGSPS